MNVQAQLALFAPPAPPPGEIDRLCDYLATRDGWTTAKEITAALAFTDRKIRQLAENSEGRIVSGPGCPGYLHFDRATCQQLDHVANQLLSQGRSMIRRSIKLRKRAHQTIR